MIDILQLLCFLLILFLYLFLLFFLLELSGVALVTDFSIPYRHRLPDIVRNKELGPSSLGTNPIASPTCSECLLKTRCEPLGPPALYDPFAPFLLWSVLPRPHIDRTSPLETLFSYIFHSSIPSLLSDRIFFRKIGHPFPVSMSCN